MKNIWDTLDELVGQLSFEKEVQAVILFGGMSRNEEHAYSDIDIFVLKDKFDHENIHMYMFYGYKIHVEYISVEDYLDKCRNEKTRIMDVLSNKIYYDRDGKITLQLDKIKEELPKSPPQLDEFQRKVVLLTVGMDVTNPLGLIKQGNICGAILVIHEKVMRIARGLCAYYGWWVVDLKNVVIRMKANNRELGNEIEAIILAVDINEKYKLYYNLCKKAETILGGYKNDIWLKTD